jgi:hypothetical protein
VDFW